MTMTEARAETMAQGGTDLALGPRRASGGAAAAHTGATDKSAFSVCLWCGVGQFRKRVAKPLLSPGYIYIPRVSTLLEDSRLWSKSAAMRARVSPASSSPVQVASRNSREVMLASC